MKIELDLNTIKRNAAKREDENYRFRSFLKRQSSDKIDSIVHEIYEHVGEKIDCTTCANCCVELETGFLMDEIDRLTAFLKVDKGQFIKESMQKTEPEEEERLYLNSTPCQFLKDKKCTIYSLRPKECREYPNLHKDHFISRLFGVISNYEVCPIVYNVYEELKRRLNFR